MSEAEQKALCDLVWQFGAARWKAGYSASLKDGCDPETEAETRECHHADQIHVEREAAEILRAIRGRLSKDPNPSTRQNAPSSSEGRQQARPG